MKKRFDAARRARQGAALRRPAHRGRQGHGRRGRARPLACLREHRAHRQRRAFATARYNPNPLIVQGPGAGPAVTAAACSPTCCACARTSERACERVGRAARRRSRRPRRQRRHRLRHPGLLGRRARRHGARSKRTDKPGVRHHRRRPASSRTFRAIRSRTPPAARCSPCRKR